MPSADIAMLTMVAICTDKDGISHLYRVPNIMKENNSSSSINIDMHHIDEDYDNDDFYDYLHDYFKLSKCSLTVI